MDAGLRSVAHALLVGFESQRQSGHALHVHVVLDGENRAGQFSTPPVIAGAEYLRDRVGVPRDLPVPAARQLRAHLNNLISQLSTPS